MTRWNRVHFHRQQSDEDGKTVERVAVLMAIILILLPVLISFSGLYPEFDKISKLTTDGNQCDGVTYEFNGENVTSQLFVQEVKDGNPFDNEVSRSELLQYWATDHLDKLGELPAEFTTFTVAFPDPPRVFVTQYIVQQKVKFKGNEKYVLCDSGAWSEFLSIRMGRML